MRPAWLAIGLLLLAALAWVGPVAAQPRGVAVEPADGPGWTGQRWAVIIAIGEYQDPSIPPLGLTLNDAHEVHALLTDPQRGGVPRANALLVTGKDATLRGIKQAIGDWLYRRAGVQDTVLIYYAGHGGVEKDRAGQERDGLAKYLLPWDADRGNLFATGLATDELGRMLAAVAAERLVVILDSCYAGGTARGGRGVVQPGTRADTIADTANERLAGSGRVVLAASRPDQVSMELARLRHGVFTYHLLEGLRGQADANGDGVVTLLEVYAHLARTVPATVRAEGGRQEPMMNGTLAGDLGLAREPGALARRAVEGRIRRLTELYAGGQLDAPYYEEAVRALRQPGRDAQAARLGRLLEDLAAGRISPETYVTARRALGGAPEGALATPAGPGSGLATAAPPAMPGPTSAPPVAASPGSSASATPPATAGPGAGTPAAPPVGFGPGALATAPPAPSAPPAASPAPAPPTAALPPGSVRVESTPPGADVFWDARPAGKTPLSLPGVAPGRYQLVLVLDGYATVIEEVPVAGGQPVRIARTLEPQAGSLEVVTRPPGARIELDGVPVGASPQKLARVRVGRHRVALSHPDHLPVEREVVVEYEQLARVEVELSPRPARVLVTSTPGQAEVWVGERKVGTTVWAGELTPGRHRIRVAKEGYEDRLFELDLGPNDAKSLDARLKRWDLGDMVAVPAGEFWMGSEAGDRYAHADEKPRHRVHLDAFAIDKHEVTNAQFRAFVDGRGYERQELWSAEGWAWRTRQGTTEPAFWRDAKWNDPRQPVVGVSWYEAEAFCRFAGKRLPTEAEWEKAARGTDGRRYPWGDAWDASRANSAESQVGRAVAVGSYPTGASPYGAQDMAGNAWEWVADWYDKDYYGRSPERNPRGPDSGQSRVLRGGAWSYFPVLLRAAFRNGHTPVNRYDLVGFRCARDLP
jgi:formylglycine-generating enzyme required for sulfatase activity